MAKILRIQTLKRDGQDDVLLSIQTRDGGLTDALFQWINPSGWVMIFELPGTSLRYSTVQFNERIYLADGKNHIYKYDGGSVCQLSTTISPVVQYLVVFQNRIVGGGDARTQTEVVNGGGVWPADSNRDRVLWSEPLDDTTWNPNSFADFNTGIGEVITGLGVNSITTSTAGAQDQLVVFKDHFVGVNKGTLESPNQELDIISNQRGCPAYNTIANTPYGLMFMSTDTICLMPQATQEPQDVGVSINTNIKGIPLNVQRDCAAFYFEDAYHLAIPSSVTATTNNSEWELDLRQVMFPSQNMWYGPHSGDTILQYETFRDTVSADNNPYLIAAQQNTLNIWHLNTEGWFGSMAAVTTARTSTQKWPRLLMKGMKQAILDAFGITGTINPGVQISGSVSIDKGTQTYAPNWTAPATLPTTAMYMLLRPTRRPGHDAQVTISHNHWSDIIVDSLYIRTKPVGKQSVKQDSSTQT